jgi:hypothetical protein
MESLKRKGAASRRPSFDLGRPYEFYRVWPLGTGE